MLAICQDKVKLKETSVFCQKGSNNLPPPVETLWEAYVGSPLGVPMGVDEEQAHWAWIRVGLIQAEVSRAVLRGGTGLIWGVGAVLKDAREEEAESSKTGLQSEDVKT